MLLVIWCGWFLYTRQDASDTHSLIAGFLVLVFPMIYGFAVNRGYLQVRSQDSWFRIIGATILIIVAAVLVSAVGILIVLRFH